MRLAKLAITTLIGAFACTAIGGATFAQQNRVMSSDDIVKAFKDQARSAEQAASEERTRSMRTRGNSNFATQPVEQVAKVAPTVPTPSQPTVSLNTITFEYDSDQLTPQGREQLDKVAEAHAKMVAEQRSARSRSMSQTAAQLPVVCDGYSLVGHTDLVGSESYNDQLSRRRADEAARYLRTKGVDIRMTDGRGKRTPLVNVNGPNEQNRRVDITCHMTATAQR